MAEESLKNDDYWRDKLSDAEFRVCRQKGTERAFSGAYWDNKAQGIYVCKCCETPLFDSQSKYDSGSGWPSFFQALDHNLIDEHVDRSLGMERVEIVCNKCQCHLGHIFPDGPQPTGMRYCVNSASLLFNAKEGDGEEL